MGFFFPRKELQYFCSSDDVEADGERKMLYQDALKLIVKFVMKTDISEHSDEGSHLVW